MVGIRVDASVNRENAIYLTGENIIVNVALRNVVQNKNSLAWGCVQLHCDQILGKQSMNANNDEIKSDTVTSLTSTKTSLYSSKPSIIFCDIQLNPSELLEYSTSFIIPNNMPPSFKGNFVKYNWYITVAVQHVDAPVKMLQIQLRVVNFEIRINLPNNSNENPFLDEANKSPPMIEFAKSAIDEMTSSRISKFFKINDGNAIFATVSLFKNDFKLGDDIVCRITFDPLSKVKCSVVTVRLESVEEDLINKQNAPYIHIHEVKYCVTMFIKDCHLILTIPGNGVPAFENDAVKLQWRLHFDFLVGDETTRLLNGRNSTSINKSLRCERIPWDHDINVYASNPFNINLAYTQSIQSVTDTV